MLNLFLVIVGGILTIVIIIGFGLVVIKQRVTSAEKPIAVQVKTVGKNR